MKAILSIKSIYATAIYEGYKTIEVRKTAIKPCERIYLYETAPKSLVTGFIQIGTPEKVTIERIIKEYLKETMLTETVLRRYAGDRQYLYLWPVIHAERRPPIKPATRAPQSFQYL